MIQVVFFVVFVAMAVINSIHRTKIKERDDYIITLYKSKKVQEFIENLKNKDSNEEELNDRDNQFDINNEISQSVKRFEQNMIMETMRNSIQQNTDLCLRESIQLHSSNVRDSRQHILGNMKTTKINPIACNLLNPFEQCNKSSEVELPDHDCIINGDSEEVDLESREQVHLDSPFTTNIIRSVEKGIITYNPMMNEQDLKKAMNKTY